MACLFNGTARVQVSAPVRLRTGLTEQWDDCVSCAGVGVLGGQLYAAGGHDGPLVRKSVEVFDPQTNGWRLVCDMNMCRRNAGQTAPPSLWSHWGLMLLLGPQCVWRTFLMRFLPPGVCAINGLLYVIGGDDGSCNLSSVEFYNPAADKWSLIPTNMSNGRSYAGQDDFFFFSVEALGANSRGE